MKKRAHVRRNLACSFLVLAFAACVPALAQRVKARESTFDDLAFQRPEMQPAAVHVTGAESAPAPCVAFLGGEGKGWRLVLDEAAGAPALLEGRGIPWLPGTASGIPAPAGLPKGTESAWRLQQLEAQARAFLDRYPGLLGARSEDLVLNPEASGRFSDYLDYADFQWVYTGLEVEGARVVFRVNHGNLVQMGQEFVSPAIRHLDPHPSLSLETAWQVLWAYAGGRSGADEIVEPGRLLVIPVTSRAALEGRPFAPGEGLAYRLVYRLAFHRTGVQGTWDAVVDAHTGELLSFQDSNRYGRVRGGAYVADQPSPELTRPFPYADVGGAYADAQGIFQAAADSTLNGKYVKIVDTCGPIDLSPSGADLEFGKSGRRDCGTPGFGGDGNTRAARTQYYNVNQIRAKAQSFLPNNAWLNSQIGDRVNLQQTCNAYWDGKNLNFFASGGGCGNTGELPGVSLHEWGHGLDQNDGTPPADGGTGESYADLTALMQGHASCMGSGFLMGQNCDGYGSACLSCTGVRDLDYAKHRNPSPATASQLAGVLGYHCPSYGSYGGPCGYEGHCESAIISQAVWDLAARDLPASGLDQATAWELVEGFWFLSRPTAGSAYTCQKSTLATDGCGVSNTYSVFRVVDDCDGDLSNGTPHGAAIFAALDRHGIACATANHDDQNCCGSFAAPTLTASVQGGGVALAWTAVPGAGSIYVFRSENTCDSGYTRIASLAGSATSYQDEDLPPGLFYNYRVQPYGATQACAGPMSACASVASGIFVEASAHTYPGGPPLTETLTAVADGGQAPYTYAWDFGDGSQGTGDGPIHVYTALGDYVATVTATDSASQTAQASVLVKVIPPPAIASVRGKNNPYRLFLTGTNFHQGCTVQIDGNVVASVWKSATQVQTKGVAYYVPKGRTVSITVTNQDDGITSAPFSFSR